MSEEVIVPPETREDRSIRRMAATGLAVVAAMIVGLLTHGAVDAQSFLSEELPPIPVESPRPAIPAQELQQIAEAFNSIPIEHEHFFSEDSHLLGGVLSFAKGAIQQPGDGSGGWRYLCGFRTDGGVMAETCEARIIYNPSSDKWILESLSIDGDYYSL